MTAQWWGVGGKEVVGPYDTLLQVKEACGIRGYTDCRRVNAYRYGAYWVGTAQALAEFKISTKPAEREARRNAEFVGIARSPGFVAFNFGDGFAKMVSVATLRSLLS